MRERAQVGHDVAHTFEPLLDVVDDQIKLGALLRRNAFPLVAQREQSGQRIVQRVVDLMDDARAQTAKRGKFFRLHQLQLGFLDLLDGIRQLIVLLGQFPLVTVSFNQIFHTRLQFHRGKRLGEKIVGTDLQRFKFRLFIRARREQDDRDARGRRVFAQLAAHLQAVLVRHHQVEQNKIGRDFIDFLGRVQTVHRLDDFIFVLQLGSQKPAHIRLVVGHEQQRPVRAAGKCAGTFGFARGGQRGKQIRAAIKIGEPFLVVLRLDLGGQCVGARGGGEFVGFQVRQPDGEGRAFAFLALHGNSSGLDFYQLFHEREADADALKFPFRRAVFLPETVEDERQAFFRDAHAGIADDEQKFHAIFFHAQPDAPAVRCELQGVEKQVERDFFQLVVVAQNHIQFGIHVGFKRDFFGDSQLADGTGEAVDEFRDGDGVRLDLQPPGFEPDEVEQIIDELEQSHAVGLHGQEHIAPAGVELGLIFLDERFQRRKQQGQRRA